MGAGNDPVEVHSGTDDAALPVSPVPDQGMPSGGLWFGSEQLADEAPCYIKDGQIHRPGGWKVECDTGAGIEGIGYVGMQPELGGHGQFDG